MIRCTCAHCGLQILVPDTVQGRVGQCFGCGAQVQVPTSAAPVSTTAQLYSEGDRVADRYQLGPKIGEGGMGVVFMAKDELTDEDIALKFMNPRALRTQKGQQLFIKEAQVARRLRHENVVAVHDVSTTPEGVLYLSMELIRGRSLREVLMAHRQERKVLTVRVAVQITLQVLKALEYAHRMVVHRDLKPENVMLLPGERVKVLDFGLALAVQEDLDTTPAPGSGKKKRVVGTAAYAAPEQRKQVAIDFRADIYCVGLLLRELLTLRTPVDEPVTIMEVRQDVSPSIIEVLDKALMTDRERRWQSAADFKGHLRAAYEESYKNVNSVAIQTADGVKVSTENMIYLEGGSFLMGSNDVRTEAPEFETHVDPFYMDIHPVTCEEYEEFMKATEAPEPKFWHDPEFNGPRQPVTGITLREAMAYAAWAGKSLPTEAQWEFAARGKENRKYPWGMIEPDTTRCNFNDYLGMPSIVTMHDSGATPEGLLDMAGNIYEWTLDAYAAYQPQGTPVEDASKQPRRVARGGSWHSSAAELRTTNRKGLFPESRLTTVGFRCVFPAEAP